MGKVAGASNSTKKQKGFNFHFLNMEKILQNQTYFILLNEYLSSLCQTKNIGSGGCKSTPAWRSNPSPCEWPAHFNFNARETGTTRQFSADSASILNFDTIRAGQVAGPKIQGWEGAADAAGQTAGRWAEGAREGASHSHCWRRGGSASALLPGRSSLGTAHPTAWRIPRLTG